MEPSDVERARGEKRAVAVRTTERVNLDGRLDEPAWTSAPPVVGFVQRSPQPGRPSSERTEALFLYDENNLYVAIICFDSVPAGIVSHDLEKDFNFRSSDNVEIAIDSLYGLRSAFYFRTNPAGAKADAQISDETFNYDWDGVWDVRTSVTEDGWIAEFVIPFKTLRFSTAATQTWGINMGRKVIRANEDTFWFYPPLPIRYTINRVSLFGTLEGLSNIRQGRNLKVTPFVTAGTTQRPSGTGSGLSANQQFDGGVDLKYSLNPSLTLDLTYRTDFAHVEVDRQQVNLTRFSLLFPEKRHFFLENSGNFAFGAGNNLIPFFSRRIGLSASGTPIQIVGGARLSGRVGRYDVGVLAIRTDEEGSTPANTYTVARVKRHLLKNSWIGALTTNRDSTISGDYNRVFGADAYFQFYDRLSIDSHVLRSDTPGRPGQDQARQLEVAWREEELTAAAGYNELQTNFNPEVGFVRRGSHTQYEGSLAWMPRIDSSEVVRNLVFGTTVEYFEDEATRQVETRTQRVNAGVAFENNAAINVAAVGTFDRLADPFQIGRGVVIRTGDYRYLSYTADATSNPGRRVAANAAVDVGEFWDGHHTAMRGGVQVKPNSHLGLEFDYRRDQVDLPSGAFTSHLVGTRLTYAFNPRAFLNGLFQYNSTTGQVISNVRFNLIHRPLSDVFVVYNDLRDNSGRLLQRAIVVKVTNLVDF